MNDALLVSISLIIGLFVGLIFFVGLWWTIHTGLRSDHPAMLFLASLFLRTTMTLSGFYFVGVGLNRFQNENQIARLMTCLFGFLLARFFVSRKLNLTPPTQVDIEASQRGARNAH